MTSSSVKSGPYLPLTALASADRSSRPACTRESNASDGRFRLQDSRTAATPPAVCTLRTKRVTGLPHRMRACCAFCSNSCSNNSSSLLRSIPCSYRMLNWIWSRWPSSDRRVSIAPTLRPWRRAIVSIGSPMPYSCSSCASSSVLQFRPALTAAVLSARPCSSCRTQCSARMISGRL